MRRFRLRVATSFDFTDERTFNGKKHTPPEAKFNHNSTPFMYQSRFDIDKQNPFIGATPVDCHEIKATGNTAEITTALRIALGLQSASS